MVGLDDHLVLCSDCDCRTTVVPLEELQIPAKISAHGTVDRIRVGLSNNIGLAAVFSAVFLVLAAAMWSIALSRSTHHQNLSVRFLQTSHGESIFIETPNRNRMLIDGGVLTLHRWQTHSLRCFPFGIARSISCY